MELNEAAKTYQNVIEKIPKGHDLYGYVQFLKDQIPKLEEMSTSFARTVGSEIKSKSNNSQIDLKAIQNVKTKIKFKKIIKNFKT